jgi:hypothetical protein
VVLPGEHRQKALQVLGAVIARRLAVPADGKGVADDPA